MVQDTIRGYRSIDAMRFERVEQGRCSSESRRRTYRGYHRRGWKQMHTRCARTAFNRDGIGQKKTSTWILCFTLGSRNLLAARAEFKKPCAPAFHFFACTAKLKSKEIFQCVQSSYTCCVLDFAPCFVSALIGRRRSLLSLDLDYSASYVQGPLALVADNEKSSSRQRHSRFPEKFVMC